MNEIRVKLLENAFLPMRMTDGAAGYDLFAHLSAPFELFPRCRAKIPAGVCFEIPQGVVGLVFARSGFAIKHGISMANGVGVIDSDFRGEVNVLVRNDGDLPFTFTNGMRFAQIVFTPVYTPKIVLADELSDTDRGKGGFGSTGVKDE
jgi:deoxyuridine 5''-triphosphate nucleotidohydrolase (dut)